MRKLFTRLFIVFGSFYFSYPAYSQGNGDQNSSADVTAFTTFSFSRTSEGSFMDLSFYVKDNGNKNDLGISSFVVQYDSSAIKYQLQPVSNALLINGYFTSGLESYMDPYSMHYGTHCHSLEIDCDDATSEIPDTATLMGTIRFKIVNTNGLAGISWKKNYSDVFNGKSKLMKVDFVEPERIALSGASLDFNADLSNDRVLLLNRLTLSERAKMGVEVERSKDGIHFEPFEAQVIQSNSTQDLEYSAYDPHPYPHTSFYRLVSKKDGKKVLLGMLTIHRT